MEPVPHSGDSYECNNRIRSGTAQGRTLAEAERDHIVEVLRHAGGVISGQNGAAARLGMKRTTLQYRMRKLGIGQKRVFDTAEA